MNSRLVGFVFCILTLPAQAAIPTFQHDILPLVQKHCITCHGATRPLSNGLDLSTLAGVMTGANSGRIVVPGNPDASRMWIVIRDGIMPLGGTPLSAAEKQLVREWIATGQFPASDDAPAAPRKERITAKDRQWWSFRTPVKPPVPAVRSGRVTRSPIDAFIEQKLAEKKWAIGARGEQANARAPRLL